jgi:hypothetical protein
MGETSCTLATKTVYPEPVEGLPFFGPEGKVEGQGFDKLSPNGLWVEYS